MKCVILLACLAAAHAQLLPFYNYKMGVDVFNYNTGMPMAFLRKKRDLDAMGRVTAIHVPNVMTYGRLGYGGIGMGLNRAIYLRKKRDADQKASSQLFMMDWGLGMNYDYLNYPFLMRKKRDADQKASSQLFMMDWGLGMNYDYLNYPILMRKKRDADQKASSQMFMMDWGLGMNYDYLHYPFLMRKKRDADQKASAQMFVMDTMRMPIMDRAYVMPMVDTILLKK